MMPSSPKNHPLVVNVREASVGSYVYVGRQVGKRLGSKFGNPYRIGLGVATREEAVDKFRDWFHEQPELVQAAVAELKGQALGCWCAPAWCHASILAEAANAPEIKMVSTSIFECNADFFVNPVNCVGAMGKGLAAEFKRRYPDMFTDYKRVCQLRQLVPGHLHMYSPVLNFPTKDNWREPSTYTILSLGLRALRGWILMRMRRAQWVRIAIPALGCGLGGLDWEVVAPMLQLHLCGLNADITVCAPQAGAA